MRIGPSRAKWRAFTLVELMVVLAVIGIVAGAMVAEMGGTFEEALLRETARKIMDACDTANARAVATGRAHILLLDSREGKFVARAKGSAPEIASSGELDTRIAIDVREPAADEEEEAEGEIAAERERRTRAEAITFFADGSCEPREFFLKDRTGAELALRLNPITSRIRVMEGAPQ